MLWPQFTLNDKAYRRRVQRELLYTRNCLLDARASEEAAAMNRVLLEKRVERMTEELKGLDDAAAGVAA